MEKNAKFFREAAWAQLKGNWKPVVLFTLVYNLVAGVAQLIGSTSDYVSILISLFVLIPLAYGFNIAFLGFKRTGEAVKIEQLFDGFKDYSRVVLTNLLQGIYIFLWTLLLFIPGIIKSFSYSLTNFILKDYPELKYNGAIELSMAMMKGHKFELFCLSLSFIGWMLLGILTLGIGFLWITPYINTALAHFYEHVKEEYEKSILINQSEEASK